jgi:hypothetical protein
MIQPIKEKNLKATCLGFDCPAVAAPENKTLTCRSESIVWNSGLSKIKVRMKIA